MSKWRYIGAVLGITRKQPADDRSPVANTRELQAACNSYIDTLRCRADNWRWEALVKVDGDLELDVNGDCWLNPYVAILHQWVVQATREQEFGQQGPANLSLIHI